MIEINFGKTTIEGNEFIIATEIGVLFQTLNEMLDSKQDPIFEELIVCSDLSYNEFCKLAVRLNEAHKRTEDIKRAAKVKQNESS